MPFTPIPRERDGRRQESRARKGPHRTAAGHPFTHPTRTAPTPAQEGTAVAQPNQKPTDPAERIAEAARAAYETRAETCARPPAASRET